MLTLANISSHKFCITEAQRVSSITPTVVSIRNVSHIYVKRLIAC